MQLHKNPRVITLAAELGVGTGNPVTGITSLCIRKITAIVKKCGGVRSIAELEALVCRELRLVFEEAWSDEDLESIITKYVRLGEIAFLALRSGFDQGKFGTLMQRRHIDATSHDRYVAIIDCRGDKAHRRFFTRWHEIAHLLTSTRQILLPFNRSPERDPVEQVIDIVAAEVGFYPPLFVPILRQELGSRELTFDVVEQVRESACPEASFQSTLSACVRHAPHPTLLVEATLGLKRDEERALAQSSLFPAEAPTPKLRAVTVIPNDAARASGLRIHSNMRVPEESVMYFDISRDADTVEEHVGPENLAIWTDSVGNHLEAQPVRIQARRSGHRVVALVTPLRASTKPTS
jgi:hypothetical protein